MSLYKLTKLSQKRKLMIGFVKSLNKIYLYNASYDISRSTEHNSWTNRSNLYLLVSISEHVACQSLVVAVTYIPKTVEKVK